MIVCCVCLLIMGFKYFKQNVTFLCHRYCFRLSFCLLKSDCHDNYKACIELDYCLGDLQG